MKYIIKLYDAAGNLIFTENRNASSWKSMIYLSKVKIKIFERKHNLKNINFEIIAAD